MRHFIVPILLSIFALFAAYFWGGVQGLTLAFLLGIMEISLSFDNAILNSVVLKTMNSLWRNLFLTIGIFIAVFGMRLIFPMLVISLSSNLSFWQVFELSLYHPEEYSKHIMDSNIIISAFGGIFLILVFLTFMLNPSREIQWWRKLERKFKKLGEIKFVAIICALVILLMCVQFLPNNQKWLALSAGSIGIIIFGALNILSSWLNISVPRQKASSAKSNLAMLVSFLYLEVLDASFSFDGVIAAFAITKDIVIIMLGLGIGAIFVRSLTVFLVQKRSLEKFIYLEHGAHYAIGVLGIIMLMNLYFHVSEIITGLIGVGVIGLAVLTSRHPPHLP